MNHFLQPCINHGFNFLTNFEVETCTWVCIVLDLHSECDTWETEIIYELEKGLLICKCDISRTTNLMASSIVLFYRRLALSQVLNSYHKWKLILHWLSNTTWKSSKCRVFSGPYFSQFVTNSEIYSVNEMNCVLTIIEITFLWHHQLLIVSLCTFLWELLKNSNASESYNGDKKEGFSVKGFDMTQKL